MGKNKKTHKNKKDQKASTVEIVCILDRSGSMMHLAPEVIGSYNEFIQKQSKEEGKAKVTLVLFDNDYEVVYSRIKLKNVPALTPDVYFARGLTSMYDAIGKTLTSEDFKDKKDVMVLIQTDGYENSSHEYNKVSIKALIEEKEKLGWDFIFLGANIDTVQAGASMGVVASKTASFNATPEGVRGAYTTMSSVTTNYRKTKLDEFNAKAFVDNQKDKGKKDD